MPEFTKHVETTLSYSDLQTTDIQGAKSFYASLFGWEINEVPMGPDQFYVQFQKDGKTVVGASQQQPEQAQMGIPPAWYSYFTVSDVDKRTKEAEQAGGAILSQPFDVFDAGRMSIVADPNGAVFCMWQPKNDIGAHVMYEPNTLTWTECTASDVVKAQAFYKELFGWGDEDMGASLGGDSYIVFDAAGQQVCGLTGSPMPGIPSYWLNYFNVTSCAATVDEAKKLGADVKLEPTTIPTVGTFAVITDPQGATFGVLEPEPQQA